MKLFFVFLALASSAVAGELSKLYWKDALARQEAIQKQEEAESQKRAKETDPLKRLVPLKQIAINDRPALTNHGISELGIERTRCLGKCAEYTFIVTRDGKCRYFGGEHAPVKGNKTGRVSIHEFNRIAQFAIEISFAELKDEYDSHVSDVPGAYSTAVIGGKRKLIRHYADAGPSRLWAFESLMDGMLSGVKWD